MGYITGLCFKYYHNLISLSDTLSCKQAGNRQGHKLRNVHIIVMTTQDHLTSNCVWMTMQQAQMVRHLHVQLLSTACVQCAGARGFEVHAVGAAAMHQQGYLYFLRGKDACSHHAEHINSKLSPPVGCWFWVVPRSMLLEALTCWNCRWFWFWLWFWAGDWGWARLEVWEFSLEQINEAVTVVGRVLTSSELW